MNSFLARRILGALLALFGTASIARSAPAQTARHVTVALVEQLAESAAVQIVRSPGANGSTLVMLRASMADEVTLGAAMRALSRSRMRHGDALRSPLVIKLYRQRPGGTLPPNERLIARNYFARLRGAPQTQVAGVGIARLVQMPVAQVARFASTR
jgi:hypothetical protein